MLIRLLYIFSVLVLASCASVPAAIDGEGFQNDITPVMVTNNPEAYIGQRVRWGGVIVEVVNNQDETWIEILGLPLSDTARPLSDRTQALGRFIVKTAHFLDPEVYQKGLRMTVTGTLDQTISGKVGERDYIYPAIQIDNHYLWPRRTQHRHYVTPGYWFYGFHPHWRFGYPYFGYGVWSYHNHYYPYFPVYGYLSRSRVRPHHHYRAGDYAYSRNLDWSAQRRAWELRNIRFHNYPGYSNDRFRMITNNPRVRSTGDKPQVRRNTGDRLKPSTRSTRSSSNRTTSRARPTRDRSISTTKRVTRPPDSIKERR